MEQIGLIALLLWIPLTLALFASLRPQTACIASFLGAYLFLPVGISFDFPGLPAIGRFEIAALASLVAVLQFCPDAIRRARIGRGIDLVIVAVIAAGFVTALTNGESIPLGDETTIPGMRLYDAFSLAAREIFSIGIPFILGRALYRRPADLHPLLSVLVLAGLGYSVLVLWEVRMSPNLHSMIYGVAPHSDFSQTFRWGGWRPQVFVGHGLFLSMLMLHTALAAFGLWKARLPVFRLRPTFAIPAYLSLIVLACKSLGAILLGGVAMLAAALFKPRVQIRIAVVLCVFAVSYPIFRTLDLVPTESLTGYAGAISAAREESLAFRFFQEGRLLERAHAKELFGWGTWGRNEIYDPETGMRLSTPDGYWVIMLGAFGIVGYAARYLLLMYPILLTAKRFARLGGGRERILALTIVWILTVLILDMIPNAGLRSLHYLMAGALAGSVSLGAAARRSARRRGPASRAPRSPQADAPRGRSVSGTATAARMADLLTSRRTEAGSGTSGARRDPYSASPGRERQPPSPPPERPRSPANLPRRVRHRRS